jgi:hypothetical protein
MHRLYTNNTTLHYAACSGTCSERRGAFGHLIVVLRNCSTSEQECHDIVSATEVRVYIYIYI